MRNLISIYRQYVVPQHAFTAVMGWLAAIRAPWLKNWMINRFIRKYHVDMSAAAIEDPSKYIDFNQFFIRQLKPDLRPIAMGLNTIVSPVDGTIAQIGSINKNQLLQAKGFYFDLESLLGGDSTFASKFYDGAFATLYLAPCDYHRVHMPLSGSVAKTIYVPGKLFSVNRMTSELIPHLYSRNERLITIFNTPAGPMAVILIGAMIVGSIQSVWMTRPIKDKKIQTNSPVSEIHLRTGAELGHFKLGSTVILLFGKNRVQWDPSCNTGSAIKYGQLLGSFDNSPVRSSINESKLSLS